jgi:hypothetical protein
VHFLKNKQKNEEKKDDFENTITGYKKICSPFKPVRERYSSLKLADG